MTAPLAAATPLPTKGILALSRLAQEDREALRLAADLAAYAQVPLTILTVVDPGGDVARLGRLGVLDPDAVTQRVRDAAERDLLEQLQSAGIDPTSATCRIAVGKPWLETIRTLVSIGADWLIKTAETRDGDPRSGGRLASTDLHLLRKCPATVWLHRAELPRPGGPILLPLDVNDDPEGEPDTRDRLNAALVSTGAAMSAWLGLRTVAVSAWTAPGEALVRRWAGAGGVSGGPEDVDRYRILLEEAEWRGLRSLLSNHWPADQGMPEERVILGHARKVIVEALESERADLLIIGTVARTGMPGLLIGNTAEDVLSGSAVSVIAVKPPGYTSPLSV